jgi:uncharacterized membrane protein SirB2
MGYAVAKHVHVIAAFLTIGFFALRGLWMIVGSPMLARRWVRIVPHVNDTLLLAAAIYLATVAWGWQPWIAAKVTALVAYVVLGSIALRRGRTRAVRATAFFGALVAVGYIVAVAFAKRPWPFA